MISIIALVLSIIVFIIVCFPMLRILCFFIKEWIEWIIDKVFKRGKYV